MILMSLSMKIQADLIDGTNALSSPYTNTLADQQTIYVRVENKDTGCVNDDFTFEVIVNPLPKFTGNFSSDCLLEWSAFNTVYRKSCCGV
jgi:hypothetical protein